MLQLKHSGCCHCWWLLWFGLVVVVPISVDFFFISFQFGLHITNFSLKFRPVQPCRSRRRAAAAHHVSWRSDTKLNCTGQPHTRQSDTNQPNTSELCNSTSRSGSCYVNDARPLRRTNPLGFDTAAVGFGVNKWLEWMQSRVIYKVRSPSRVTEYIGLVGCLLSNQKAL